MKKFIAALVLLSLIGGAALFLNTSKLDMLSRFGMINEDEKKLAELAFKFLEAIQYKDFATAASLHNAEDRKSVDIAKLIENLFKVKPEVLNIRDLTITRTTIDSTGTRARTYFDSNIEVLNSLQNRKKSDAKRKERNVEGILYWHKEDGEWKLKLKSSLQRGGIKSKY